MDRASMALAAVFALAACGRVGYVASEDSGAIADSTVHDSTVVDAPTDAHDSTVAMDSSPRDSAADEGVADASMDVAPDEGAADAIVPDASVVVPEVAVGAASTCVRLTSGRVRCVGCNGSGALGDGTGMSSTTFVDAVGITDAQSIWSGDEHVCVVHPGGTGSCWGWNVDGSIGDRGTADALSPVAVMITGDLQKLIPARTSTCALLRSGAVQCFGDNAFGQLGDGTETDRNVPAPVVGLPLASDVAGAEGNFCALTRDGAVYCWGWGTSGQLGNGTFTTHQTTPVRAGTIGDAVAIAVGHEHACAVRATGELWCWGSSFQGELGDGTLVSRSVPGPVTGLTNVVGVAAGYVHTCALLATGQVRCFGWAADGHLGDGQTSVDQLTPSIPVIGLDDAVQISAGTIDGPTCAVRRTGDIVCWGPNSCGQLTDGTRSSSAVPVPLVGF